VARHDGVRVRVHLDAQIFEHKTSSLLNLTMGQ